MARLNRRGDSSQILHCKNISDLDTLSTVFLALNSYYDYHTRAKAHVEDIGLDDLAGRRAQCGFGARARGHIGRVFGVGRHGELGALGRSHGEKMEKI